MGREMTEQQEEQQKGTALREFLILVVVAIVVCILTLAIASMFGCAGEADKSAKDTELHNVTVAEQAKFNTPIVAVKVRYSIFTGSVDLSR